MASRRRKKKKEGEKVFLAECKYLCIARTKYFHKAFNEDNCRPNFTHRYRHVTQAKVTQSCPSFWEASWSKQYPCPEGLWAQELRPHSQLFWERQTRSASNQWRTSEMSQTCRICCNTRCKRGCENWQVRCVYSLCHLILETRAEIQRSSTTPRGGGKLLAPLQSHSLG